MLYRIWKLAVKELIQLVRDRLLGPFVLLGPLAELLMVAWSTSQGIEHLPTAVLDLDRSAASICTDCWGLSRPEDRAAT